MGHRECTGFEEDAKNVEKVEKTVRHQGDARDARSNA